MGYGGSWNSGYSRTSASYRYQSKREEEQQEVEDTKCKYAKAIEEIETKRCDVADSLVKLGTLRIKTWYVVMPTIVQAFENISLESLNQYNSIKRVPNNDWEPKKFLETVEKSSSLVGELVNISNKTMDDGDFISVAGFGGPVLFCSPFPEEILATINEMKYKNGAVAWFSGLAKPDNYTSVVSRLVLSDVDVLPFLSIETKRASKNVTKMDSFMFHSDLMELSREINSVTRKLVDICQEIDYIKTVTNQVFSLTENLQMCLSQLMKDVWEIEKEYHDVMHIDTIKLGNLSEMECRTVVSVWEISQKLVDLLVLPIVGETGGVSSEAQGFISKNLSHCNILCNSAKHLLWEKEEIARVLKASREYVASLEIEYRDVKEKTRESLLCFARYKLAKLNVEFKDYFSVLNRLDDAQLESGFLGLAEICKFNSDQTKRLTSQANRFASSKETGIEKELISFAVNSLGLNEDKGTLYEWLVGVKSEENKVEGIGDEEFKNAELLLKRITGKENLMTAKTIYENVIEKCLGIQSVISKMRSLVALMENYEETMDNISSHLRPIAERVVLIGMPYDVTDNINLTSQEKKTITVSWEYGQLLFQMLTDLFYDDKKACFVANEERPQEVKTRFKPLRQALFKLKGENAYAADPLWKKPAERAKWVSFSLVVLLVIMGVVASIQWSIKGLLLIFDACIAFPVFFVKKDMPLNQVTFWRWVRVASAVLIAVAIIVFMIV